MKVTAKHFAVLQSAIKPLDTPEHREMYRQGNFARADAVKDLDKRYRWDLYWAAWSGFQDAYGYTDAHIDTALRAIVPAL